MTWWDEVVSPVLNRYEVVGTVGAVLGWLGAPGDTMRIQAFNLLAGIATAIFVAPYVVELTHVSSKAGQMFLVFLLGLLGMNLLAKTIAAAKAADVWSIVAAFMRLKKPESDK